MIEVKRIALKEVLKEFDKPVLLPFSKKEIREILFEERTNEENEEYLVIADTLLESLKAIDFSNVSFDNVCVKNFDFRKIFGAKLNPQTIYAKDLSRSILDGVEFIGHDTVNQIDIFEGVKLFGTNFAGSKGARINPQTIHKKDLSYTILTGVDFTGYSFDNSKICGADFTGSVGVIINPNKLDKDGLNGTKCNGVCFSDLPNERTYAKFADLEGSNYAELRVKVNEYKEKIYQILKKDLRKV